MKKSRRKRKRPAVRLLADVTQVVSQLASGTGWSANKSLAFMARAGWNALNSGSDKIAAMRQVMTAAVAHHETERAMRKRLAGTADKLRSAQRALTHSVPDSEKAPH
jgi:hypothetical protein